MVYVSCMKTHEWTFATVGTTVHDNISEVLIAGSLSYLYSWLPIGCFTCIAEQVTSEVVDMFSRGGRPLDCHFANTGVEMATFVCSAVQLWRQCFIIPWIQTALFLIIAIAGASAAVSWQFAGWISLIPPRLYSTAVNKVWCLQCGQRFYHSCFNYELQRFGAAIIPQIWDALISLMIHVVWKRAKNTPIADPATITRWPL